jgi:hypothetical protein
MNSIKMTTKNFIIKEGRVCCTDKEVPEEPKKVNCGGTHACTCAGLAFERGANRDVVDGYDDNCPYRYAAALQLIKDNAVPFHPDDQDKAYGQLLLSEGAANESVLYPMSMEVEICDVPMAYYFDRTKKYKRLARIVEEPVETDTYTVINTGNDTKVYKNGSLIPSAGRPNPLYLQCKPSSQVEDQEELWKDVFNNYVRWSDQEEKTAELLKDFQISRRK